MSLRFKRLAFGLLMLGTLDVAIGDTGDKDPERKVWNDWVPVRSDVAAVSLSSYAEECGSCHMAYQPALLPALAWARVMDPAALADHYGDEASLPDQTLMEITTYLTAQAADQGDGQRAHGFALGAPGIEGPGGPLPRVTASAYFKRKHGEIPARMVRDNTEVGGFSQCNTCHQGAADGVYHEDGVRIPGFGAWAD